MGLIIAIMGVAINQVPLVILGVIFGLLAVAIAAMQRTQGERQADPAEELSPESRILLRPLKKLLEEMEKAASGKSENVSQYLAEEALQESRVLLRQSAAALQLRDRLIKESRGGYGAQKSADELQARLTSSTNEDERTSLQGALEARKQEIGHYETVEEGIKKIESSVKQAEAAMAEMRARMISGSSAGLAEQGSDPLREAVGRMKALSSSLSEAQEMLQVREQ
ncbi:MAG: hypothetical protein QOJ65_45 [Fimbriimonadaceae bacterium]|nr:hypothetical protein [Fimbriimonadaceae bacterium]